MIRHLRVQRKVGVCGAAIGSVVLLGAALLAARPAIGQNADSAAGLASSYRTYNLFLGQSGDVGEQDLFFTLGRAYLWGDRGGWMLRGGLGGGISFWGSVRDLGVLGGARLGMVRTWTGTYLDLGVPTEIYGVVDGGAYVAWNMEETPGERSLIPMAAAGFGLRFQGERRIGTLEVLWEERVGAWAPRMVWRFGLHVPRGEPEPQAPAPRERQRTERD